jgi:hypothetical protein
VTGGIGAFNNILLDEFMNELKTNMEMFIAPT